MKCLLVVCDGMADRPIKELGGKTPLEKANTPNLDSIAKNGVSGIVDTIAPGIRPGSDTAHLAILGYDPLKNYTGRGPFEAAGVGIEVQPGDIALRCNFATVDENEVVLDRRAGRIGEGTEELAQAINDLKIPGVEIKFKESTKHRGALVLRGEGLSHQVSDSDPHREGVKAMDHFYLGEPAHTGIPSPQRQKGKRESKTGKHPFASRSGGCALTCHF
jgi:2,3-bisphosphoglycerate-independent phosphoglycerate mutase